MATLNYPQLDALRRKIATQHGRLTLWKLRDMRRTWHRTRTQRLPKQARTLKSFVAEARDAGLVPPAAPPKTKREARPRRRRSRQARVALQ